jgi:hypothetical protein
VFKAADEFTVEGRPTVRGHEGVVFTYGHESTSGPTMRCVRWRESAALAVVVCNRRSVGALPAAEILAVAEGLRPGA